MNEPDVTQESVEKNPKSLRQNLLRNTLVKITIVLLAVLTGGLLVGSVVGYFTLMEKLEAGTLEEVAERLPEDTQVVAVFRGAGELGRDFMDVLLAMPEDPDRMAEIEDQYNIDMSSPWELYSTGIDPLRPIAVALLHTETRLVPVAVEEGEELPDYRVPEWNGAHSVVAIMVPAHDEDNALDFAIDLVPSLGLVSNAEPVEVLDMRRATSRAVSLGDSCALGVENGYLFVVLSGDPNFRAGDELERVMRVEPNMSLWSSEDFAQQRALTDEDWNLMTWAAPALGERSITRFVREFLQSSALPEIVLELLSDKMDLATLDMGVTSTVSHVGADLAQFRMVMDLSPILGADPIRIGSNQEAGAVGSEGIFPLVSGTPLLAARFSVDMDYLWTDWLAENAVIREELEMQGLGSMVDSTIGNMTGNISLAIVARDNPVNWSEGDDFDIPALLPSHSRLAYPVEAVLGLEFEDIDLVKETVEQMFPCDEPSPAGIRWCYDDDGISIGLTADQLIIGIGVERRAEIEAVAIGTADNFYSTLDETRTGLMSGPDAFGMVFMENMATLTMAPYFNDDIVTWLGRQSDDEDIGPLVDSVMQVLADPVEPGEMASTLEAAVAPILGVVREAAEAAEGENQRLEAELEVIRPRLEAMEELWQAELATLLEEDPDAEAPEHSAELSALREEVRELADLASDADTLHRSSERKHDRLQELVRDIEGQAELRARIERTGQVLSVISTGLQFWEDAAVVVDLDLHPVGGDFVPNLIRMVPEEVGNP